MKRPLRADDDPERGSVSSWLAVSAFVMIVLVGLVADLNGQLHVTQRARDVAASAARAGADRVEAASAVQGSGVRVDASAARAAALDFLAAAGVDGDVVVTGGTTVEVHVNDSYDTVFLGIIGIGDLDVTGSASARVVRTLGGAER